MQRISAYLLERRDGLDSLEARRAEATRLRSDVQRWLKSKGASPDGTSGSYRPEDGSIGTFATHEAVDGDRVWWMLELNEDSANGQRFAVGVSITTGHDRIAVYVTLETGWTSTVVQPVAVDPRCPRIVRELVRQPGRWYNGTWEVRQPQTIVGFDQGLSLTQDITSVQRTLPMVLISKRDGQFSLPELDRSIGYDLIGLANVVVVDEEASWALTDILGRRWSCFGGAIRLIWPRFDASQHQSAHPLWTEARIRSSGDEPVETRERLRRQLRSMVFRAAALSALRPSDIDEVRDAGSLQHLAALKRGASSAEDYRELAETYAKENDAVRGERDALREQIEQLRKQMFVLESRNQSLLAKSPVQAAESDVGGDEGRILPSDDEGEDDSPKPGDVRYYKCVVHRPTHDVMELIADCGCNRWQGAHKADKAKKGIAKFERGRNDWDAVHKCARCTGGGVWRVRW